MSIAELFVAIGIKIENLDQLTALETMLRNVTQQARDAVAAIKSLNAVTTGSNAPLVNPATVPAGPTQPMPAPLTPGQNPLTPTPANPVPSIPALPTPAKVVNWTAAVKKLSSELNKLAVAVTVVSTAVVVMISKAVDATMQMANFGTATGLSTDRLQEFQHAAAVGGSSAKGMLEFIDQLQSKQAAIALGEGDLSPFAFFGIDPNQDTNSVIDQLRIKLRTFSKEQIAIAREMASRLGISRDLFAALQRQSQGLSKAFILDQSAINSTQDLNSAWSDLLFKLDAIRNQLVSVLAPAFTIVAKAIAWCLEPIAAFVKWLNSGSELTNFISKRLQILAIILGFISVAIIAVASSLSLVAIAMGIATAATTVLGTALWASGIAEIILLITAAIAGFIAYVGIMVLAINDLWVTIEGGDSYLRRIGQSIYKFVLGPINALKEAFLEIGDFVSDIWNGVVSDVESAINYITGLIPNWVKKLLGFGGSGGATVNPMQTITHAAAAPPSNQGGTNSTTSQNNDVTINVDGSKDPRATAGAVDGALKRSYANATYQMPVVSY